MPFTDFPNGLSGASDYLSSNNSLTAELTGSVADIGRFIVSGEMDNNLKEIICSLMAGRGLKLPNLQICISINLKELLGGFVGKIQDVLYQALSALDAAFDKFMDHLKLDAVLGRINGILGEITNIANMINFCSAPINPIQIPNVLENAMDSFLGKGKSIVDSIGTILPENIGGCLIDGLSSFDTGILGRLNDVYDDLIAGTLPDDIIYGLLPDITAVTTSITTLIDSETKVPTNYDQGGSDFAEDNTTVPDENSNAVTDTNGNVIGTVVSSGTATAIVTDTNDNVIGRVIGTATVTDTNDNVIGIVTSTGFITDANGNVISNVTGTGTGTSTGFITDGSGNVIGNVTGTFTGTGAGAGTVTDTNGNVIGTVGNDGTTVTDTNGNVIGTVTGTTTGRTTNTGIGVLYNSVDEGIGGATSNGSAIWSAYQSLGSYQVVDSDGTVYDNIFETFCDPDLIRILRRTPNPTPEISEQVPVRNYCGEIIGYTKVVSQSAPDVSVGTVPAVINQPGFDAGGLPTNPTNQALAASQAAVLTAGNSDVSATATTTTSAIIEILFDGARLTPPSGKAWFVTISAVARRSDDTGVIAIKIEGLVDNNAGTVSMLGGAGNKTTYNDTAATDNYNVLLDVTSNQFRVRIQGDTGHTVGWKVKFDFIEAP
jgi:hypothetical protein